MHINYRHVATKLLPSSSSFLSTTVLSTAITTALISSALVSPLAMASASICHADYTKAIETSGRTVQGTANADAIRGSGGNDRILSGGLSSNAESIVGLGGADRLVFLSGDAVASNSASDSSGHIRIRDMIIDNTHLNPEADSLSLGGLIGVNGLDASNIGQYLHIDSHVYDWAHNRSVIYINVEGDYSAADRYALTSSNGYGGGYGADLLLEFQAEQGDNNLARLTGHADNTVEQFQALIDMGFLELSTTDIYGSSGGDNLEGTAADELFFSGGVLLASESIRGNGGADTLVFQAGDGVVRDEANDSDGHIRVRDFIIGDTQVDTDADTLSVGDILGVKNLDASNIGDYLYIDSHLYGWASNRSAIYINLQGDYSAADRQSLEQADGLGSSGFGSDLLLEFQAYAGDNNIETLTGFADNSVEQFQALIDWGFLDLSVSPEAVCD